MAEPRLLIISDDAAWVGAGTAFEGLLRGDGLARTAGPKQAAALLHRAAPAYYTLCVVDLRLAEIVVRRIVALAAAAGTQCLAVADRYSPRLRERAAALQVIDCVVATAEDPGSLAQSVARLLKNRDVRVLVVEDSSFMRLFLRRLLRRYQFRVFMAADAAMAMRILEARPDVIAAIIDYDMPGQNGVALTHAIRRRFRRRELCLIGVSGKAPRSISAEFLKNGADDYLHKPFEPEELYCRVLHGVENVERMLENKRLEQVRRMFLSMLAHDLKSPAGGIVGAANLVLEGMCGTVGDEVRDMVAVISQAGRRLCSLAGNMHDLTRLESGQLLPVAVIGDLGELVMERARLAAATASGKNICLETSVSEVPPMAFDPDLVARLLDNLLSNAVKFSPPKSRVRLELGVLGDEVVCRVHDSGPGILPEERLRLFRPFERLSARPTAGEKSLGLGLAIAEGIVNAHGGRIWVEDGQGRGARFCFALPLTSEMRSVAVPGAGS